MKEYVIKIKWEGPLSIEEVISNKNEGGSGPDDWAGNDYGVYQIYGPHILNKEDALLYVGQAADETFSDRFRDHKRNLLAYDNLEKIKIYLGRLEDIPEYTPSNNWAIWYRDVDIVEAILIYRYTPHYNSARLNQDPNLYRYDCIKLIHELKRGRLMPEDKAPNDYRNTADQKI